jgi:hypothetical protein
VVGYSEKNLFEDDWKREEKVEEGGKLDFQHL